MPSDHTRVMRWEMQLKFSKIFVFNTKLVKILSFIVSIKSRIHIVNIASLTTEGTMKLYITNN